MFSQILVIFYLLVNPFINPKPIAPLPAPDSPKQEGIVWQPDRRLNWEDFESEVDASDPLHAITSTNIEVKANCKNDLFRFEVKCVFVNKESWSKNKISQRLLEHEQMHFDLTEVYARLIREQLSKSKNEVCGSSKINLQQVVDQYFADWKKEQDIYDTDTNHGLKVDRQLFWVNSIAQRLENLENYADYRD